MGVKVIYTDANREEQGIIYNFDVDIDLANEMDFELSVSMRNNIMQGGSWWYINDTEYGGVVNKVSVVTSEMEIRYIGSSFRGILNDKIIEPPTGDDYRIVSGDAVSIINALLSEAGISNVFRMSGESWNVSSFQFDRYISLYDGISAILAEHGKVLRLVVKDGFITMYSDDPMDYTEQGVNIGDNKTEFNITQVIRRYNHIICLGQGELKERQVIHLYLDAHGNISDYPVYTGIEDRTAVYDYSSASSLDELRKGGIERLNELNSDYFDMSLPDMTMQIGDILGGTEEITGITVKKQVSNIIAKINDYSIDIEYSVS